MIYFRIAQSTKNKLVKLICEYKMFKLSRKYGIEIKTNTKIGKGFCMTHAYNITISPFAIIGNNCRMMKGSTIGLGSGKKPGAPKLGNRVYIGINSTVLGGINIGDDVLIAPNTFVNIDIPSHSFVMGNPCIVKERKNATEKVIWKTLE